MERKQAEADRQNQEYKDKQIFLNKWLVIITALLVASTITTGFLQLWYMHRQWKLTSDGLSKMQRSATSQNNVLAPESRQDVRVSVGLDRDRFDGYTSNKTMLVLDIKGRIVFTDVLRKRQEQPFEGWISCHHHEVNLDMVRPAQSGENNQER